MHQHCPHCEMDIAAPPISSYNENFHCPHCASTLAHSELDIVLYAAIFITVAMLALTLLCNVNSFVALPLSMIAYQLLRPSFFEPRFRLRSLDTIKRRKPLLLPSVSSSTNSKNHRHMKP
ncbi:hypothetical protein [Photobacterium frigidiphilum]|uniref:hypothetical protein n=1 Tax=Photobacterium frigidiphilum TaxID=264736 RepID=UPI003002E85F